MKNALILFLATVSAQVPAQNRSIKFNEEKWENIVQKAVKENKPIFVDCYTTWCGPCKWLAQNVFTKDEVADFYNSSFICAEIDMEKGEGPELAKKWMIGGYPSLIFCDAKGNLVHRSCGVDYRDDFYKDFIQLGKTALDPGKQFAAKKKQVESGKADSKTWAEYISILSNACVPYEEELKKYWSTQKDEDLIQRYNWNLIYALRSQDYESREFRYLLANRAKFEKLYTADSVNAKLTDVYSRALVLTSKDAEKYERLRTEVKKSGISDPDKIILSADLYKYENAKDWVNYAKTAVVYTDKYSMNNAIELNSVAWKFYEKVDDPKLLANAERWAKRSVELQPMYDNMDTYAAVLYKMGKTEEAKKQAEAAIDMAKKEKLDYKSTQELLNKMNEKK